MIDLRFQPMQQRVKDNTGRPARASPFRKSVGAGYDDLERELELLEARDVVIESGHFRTQIRNDGWPRGGSTPAHNDIRIFFTCKHGTLRYECNEFTSWEANLRAIGLWLQRQRLAIEEWGIGSGGEAYRGFAQLPPGRDAIQAAEWPTVEAAAKFIIDTAIAPLNASSLDVKVAVANREVLGEWWKDAAKRCHPDTGGSADQMSKVNRARDFIEKHTA